LKDKQTRKKATNLMTVAVFQWFFAFFLSLLHLVPMFEKHGLIGSIGSHMTWNLNVFFLYISLPARLISNGSVDALSWAPRALSSLRPPLSLSLLLFLACYIMFFD